MPPQPLSKLRQPNSTLLIWRGAEVTGRSRDRRASRGVRSRYHLTATPWKCLANVVRNQMSIQSLPSTFNLLLFELASALFGHMTGGGTMALTARAPVFTRTHQTLTHERNPKPDCMTGTYTRSKMTFTENPSDIIKPVPFPPPNCYLTSVSLFGKT